MFSNTSKTQEGSEPSGAAPKLKSNMDDVKTDGQRLRLERTETDMTIIRYL